MTSPGTATAPEQTYPLSTRVAVEALGSFFVVFAGLATALFNSTGSASAVGFAYGLALLAVIVAFGHISGGYFNPAFALGMAVAGRIKWLAAVLFMVAQTVGALLSAVVIYAIMKVMPAGSTPELPKLFGSLANGFDAHSPSQVPMVGVLIVDVVATAVIVGIILAATSARNKNVLAPVAIGLSFAVALTVTMPLSNGSLNPARATSVIFLAEPWAMGQVWLFWLAPLFGAALAAAVYRTFQPVPVAALDAGDADAATVVGKAPAVVQDQDDAQDDGALPKPVPAAEASEDEGRDDAQDFFDSPKK